MGANVIGWLTDWLENRNFYAEWEIKFNKKRKDTENDGFIVFGTIYDEMMKEQPTEWKKYIVSGNTGKYKQFIFFSFEGDTADVLIRNARIYFEQQR